MIEQEGFLQRFEAVVKRIGLEGISRRRAAKELDIGYATLKRLLDAQTQTAEQSADGSAPPAASGCRGDANAYAEVLH